MSRAVKLRSVAGWILMMLAVASVAMAHIWKQQSHVRLSRELASGAGARDALAAEVLLLETETRALRQYSRIEAVAKARLGMINPGPPVMIRVGEPDSVPARAELLAARWKGFFR